MCSSDLKRESLLLISMAAGLTLEKLASLLPSQHRIIRMMPNTPASIGQGVISYAISAKCRAEDSELFCQLLAKAGDVYKRQSLSISVRDLEKELGFKIFRRTSSGTFLTRRGMEFYEKAQELVKGFDIFQNQYANPEEEKDEFSIASQHYDFLPPTITAFSERYPDYKNFRIFESTTVQILDEVAQGHSEIGIIYLNNQNKKGIKMCIRDSLGGFLQQEGAQIVEFEWG